MFKQSFYDLPDTSYNNDVSTAVSQHSYFLSQDNIGSNLMGSFEIISTKGKIVESLVQFCASKTEPLETENLIISTEHKKETYSVLNAHFIPILEETNMNFIAVFGDSEFVDFLKSYFKFYKRFGDIKIEYWDNDENHLMIYDNKPINLLVEDMIRVQEHMTNISTTQQPFNVESYCVRFNFNKQSHNSIRMNLVNEPQKIERRLKIRKLSK